MGWTQQFSVEWNNYSHDLIRGLDDLRAEDELTDVTLCAEGKQLRAHKLVLAACSTFFREHFRDNQCQHPVIILNGVSFIDLQAVVTLMYTGQVNVARKRLSYFLQTAEMLQITGLTDVNDIKYQQDNDDMTYYHPIASSIACSIPNNTHSAASAAKKRKIVNNTSDSFQQRPPTPKRRKFIPCAPAAAGSVKLVNSNADSNSDDDYPGGVPPAVLECEPNLHEDDGDGGLLVGVEEEEFGNYLSDDDNAIQDWGCVEQGATIENISDSLSLNEDDLDTEEDGEIGVGGGDGEEHDKDGLLLEIIGEEGSGGDKAWKLWECHVCTKAFTWRCNLLAHLKQHFGNTECSFCGRVLSTVGSLKKHLGSVHGVSQ